MTLSAAQPFGAIGFEMTDREFRVFQEMIQGETGIQLPETKRLLLVGRLVRRLRALKLETFSAYHAHVASDPAEFLHMIDLISTNETHFFREPKQFEFMERELAPSWLAQAPLRGSRIRAWSAACSTGEEPYSIAMSLLSSLPGFAVDVFATDISTRVLDRARLATWPIEKSREIPEAHLKAFMLRGTGAQQGYMKATAALRDRIRFERLNLFQRRSGDPVEGMFDLIFCRNVLIYFDREGRAAAIERLLERLSPNGHLFLGHAETLSGITDRLRRVGPNVYAWPSRPEPPPKPRT